MKRDAIIQDLNKPFWTYEATFNIWLNVFLVELMYSITDAHIQF